MACISAGLGRFTRSWSLPLAFGVVALVTPVVRVVAAGACGPAFVEPEVRRLVTRGSTRVLVELCVTTQPGAAASVDAIGAAQDAVLNRLPRAGASLVRRYRTIPWLALEIDAGGLAALEAMSDLVARVLPDSTRGTSWRGSDAGLTLSTRRVSSDTGSRESPGRSSC
jgi:hypothetical protein